jgi:hypothetical protein
MRKRLILCLFLGLVSLTSGCLVVPVGPGPGPYYYHHCGYYHCR